MNLLHIDSSILGPASASRELSAAAVDRLKAVNPGVRVTYRDLAEAPLPHLSGSLLAAAQAGGGEHSAELQADLAESGAVLQEFLAADTIVIGVPLYNFGISSLLKAWIDRVLIAGQTFRYGPDGRPEGLAGDKRVLLLVTRGGHYGASSPIQSFEHAETYLRAALGFIGIVTPEVIVAEGLAIGPDQRSTAIAEARQKVAGLTA